MPTPNPAALVITQTQFLAWAASITGVAKIGLLPIGAEVIVLNDARDEVILRAFKAAQGDTVDELVVETSGIAPPDETRGTIPVVAGATQPRQFDFQQRVEDQYTPDGPVDEDHAGQLYRQLPMGDLSVRTQVDPSYPPTILSTFLFPFNVSTGYAIDDGSGTVNFDTENGRIELLCPAAVDTYTTPTARPRVVVGTGLVASLTGEFDVAVAMTPVLGATAALRTGITLSDNAVSPETGFALVLELDSQAAAEARARVVQGGVSATARDWAPVAGLTETFASGHWSLRIQRTGNQVIFWVGEDATEVGAIGKRWSMFAALTLIDDDTFEATPYLYLSAGVESGAGPEVQVNVFRILRLR